jgi:hypothetical protein
MAFTSLAYLMDIDWLKEAYHRSQYPMLIGGMMAAILTEELRGSMAKDSGHFEARLHQNNSGLESSERFGLGGGSIASPSSSIRLGPSACWSTEIWV